jgi:putative membrane protein
VCRKCAETVAGDFGQFCNGLPHKKFPLPGNPELSGAFIKPADPPERLPMNRNRLGAVSALALMLAVPALAAPADQPGHKSPKPGSNTEAMSATEDATAGLVGTVSAEMTSTTKGFVTAAATSDMYEVEAGKIAAQRGKSAGVRDFGSQMVKAHTETTAALKAVLAANHIAITPPAHLDNRRQGMIDNLRGASDADFDHRYLVQQEAAHKEAEILMRGYAKDGDNAAVRKAAADTLPKVQMHLKMVQQLEAAGGK